MQFGQINQVEKKAVKKQRKPRVKKEAVQKELYFGPTVDRAIIAYNNSKSKSKRDLLYQETIYPALEKLAENLIHVNKWYYTIEDTFEHTKQDVITFLTERLYKFDETKGKGFSYFDKIALNHLRNENKKGYKKVLQRKQISAIDTDSIDISSQYVQEQKTNLIDFFDVFIDYMDVNIPSLYKKESEQNLAMSLLSIFKRREEYEVFNKKIFYFVLRENTNATTTQITRIVSQFKRMFANMYSAYYRDGMIQTNKRYL